MYDFQLMKEKRRRGRTRRSSAKVSFGRSPENVLNQGKFCYSDREKPPAFLLTGASGYPCVLRLLKSNFCFLSYPCILDFPNEHLCQRGTLGIGTVCLFLQKLNIWTCSVGSPMCCIPWWCLFVFMGTHLTCPHFRRRKVYLKLKSTDLK